MKSITFSCQYYFTASSSHASIKGWKEINNKEFMVWKEPTICTSFPDRNQVFQGAESDTELLSVKTRIIYMEISKKPITLVVCVYIYIIYIKIQEQHNW